MTSIGLDADEMHTVIVVAVLGVVATLSTRSTQAKVAVWLTAGVGAALLIPPQPTGVLDMHQLNPPLLAARADRRGLRAAVGRQRPAPGARARRAGRALTSPGVTPDHERFAIGFDQRDRARLHELWDGVIDSNRWSEGELTKAFEAAWEAHNALPAVATVELDRRRARRAGVGAGARAQGRRAVEHVHGHAARRARRGRDAGLRRLPPRRPVPVAGRDRAADRRARPGRGLPRPHRRPHRLRLQGDRRAVPGPRRPAHRGLRARPRRGVERRPAGRLRRRGHLLDVRHEDGLDRRGRRARLPPSRARSSSRAAFATTASRATSSPG